MNKFQRLALRVAKDQQKKLDRHGFMTKDREVKQIMNGYLNGWKNDEWPYEKCIDFNRWCREQCKY